MALIIKHNQQESIFSKWYEKNKQRISDKRKRLYAEDPERRQRALAASKRYRATGSSAEPIPAGHLSFTQTALAVGIRPATLREWRRKNLFPEPMHQHGCLWFAPNQVLLLKSIRNFFSVYGKRTGKPKQLALQELIASITAKWA